MLAVQDLSFAYQRGGEELFGGLSHEFAAGKVTALTGPSGRGKSTLLYVLGLMLRPTRGRVMMHDRSLGDARDVDRAWARATTFGFVFQDAALDQSRPILDSVVEPALYAGWSRKQAAERAVELLEVVGVSARARHRPGQISGGQAQRVAVARALVNDPVVVLADEPTGNLDRDNAETVLTALHGAAGEGRTVIIATHDPFVLQHADHVLAL